MGHSPTEQVHCTYNKINFAIYNLDCGLYEIKIVRYSFPEEMN